MKNPMRIVKLEAVPISFPVPENKSVRLGIGRSVKRDSVLVRIETEDGHVGWGEAHHGRAPGAIAKLIDTTMRELVLNQDASDINGIWARVYKMQISTHGMGAAAVLALSGIDIALWDIRSQVDGQPLYRLLGGSSKKIKAYAGGIALGWQEPDSLAREALEHVATGYRALKLRVGDTAEKDIARVLAVRKAVGSEIDLLVDANTNYTLLDVRKVMPAFDEAGVNWIEEPFPPQDRKAYRMARSLGRVPFAAGENHFTRYEFATLIEDGDVQFMQPDLSKAGGVTESMRIAAMASANKLTVNPHTSATAINMATTIHYLCAVDNPGYFEGDVTSLNPFRDEMMDKVAYVLDADGFVRPYDGIGIGMKINLDFIKDHPLIDGPCYV
ncbi:mandelate racemase/muconate lactonizing enzyme family protein [Polynucleobacter sp. IMCC30063]|uniref:mandelate racemase/muconate lactonizing enzyme family protein n=1 Tax=unclassified Polynucleobacter TaxID=2640945 RepID=UPI001F1F747D|nr:MULTISPECIES: mandelate racemase/muconate lactonizing enzyme family protein [unclassified Polynucleobacter]MCE7505933.1 mandelate racemase/muconate lactonizing enzyme family protein [Polynucleobacter sp. IMCC30063]MCE7527111.1 mandelate racemase/muconate lactonizing enzyme family protein [Polynucleobacter sp. IMCC 30228]MCE7530418.1 mandelate racemase/muconate lactonizing enzyme family protein [Polynucleobacter sp. IMCC 29146]